MGLYVTAALNTVKAGVTLLQRTREAPGYGTPVIIPSVIDVSASENGVCTWAINAVNASDNSDLVSQSINGSPSPYFHPMWISAELHQSQTQPDQMRLRLLLGTGLVRAGSCLLHKEH